MQWYKPYNKIVSHVIRIETPSGSGTGFLFAYNATRTIAAIATAAHVVDLEYEWLQPIKLIHDASSTEVFLPDSDRVIFIDKRRDSASILIPADKLPLPTEPLPLMDGTKRKRVGVELAWVGYPSVAYPELCFFTGCISAYLNHDDCYLIDGVAINGVSGGPVFASIADGQLELVGSISAYMPNRVGGATLPGLLRAQDISPFHETLKTIKSLDDARKKEQEQPKDQVPPPALEP